ncbi:hypothetical protein HYW46_05560 [Candidatus Daviesbacteria bacterium]|nr:hypothetical protein [Candidatus Daviesbacteria bacterium]
MTLTPEIMKTDPTGDTWDSAAMAHDITHMDLEQLNKYVRTVFSGERNYKFLPAPFWGMYYDTNRFGGSDGKSVGSPDNLFADIYVSLGRMKQNNENTLSRYESFEYPVDFEYRGRLEYVITELLDECLNLSAKPIQKYLRLGLFAAETAKNIWLSDGPDSLEAQFINLLEEKEQISVGKLKQELNTLPKQNPKNHPLFAKAIALESDPRYANQHAVALK